MQGNSMNAMTDFRGRIGNVLGTQTLVDRFPGFAAIIRPKRARRGNRDEHSVLIFWVNKNRVQTHSARARLPLWAAVVFAEPRQLLPSCAPIFGFKKGRVFYAGVNVIGILECRLQVPDAPKFPGMLCAVVPLMRTWHTVVNEFVAFAHRHSLRAHRWSATRRVPCFTAVIGTLNDLSEPRAGLRCINPIRIRW